MEVKAKPLNLSAGKPIAVLNRSLSEKLSFNPNDRIIVSKGRRKLICVLDISDALVKQKEIGVSSEVLKTLNIKKGDKLKIRLTSKPRSLYYIHKKLSGNRLNEKEVKRIITDIVTNALTEAEIAYFVSGVYNNGMSKKETISLIKSMAETGKIMKFNYKIVADKHSIGGVAGNRTTPILVPICAAAGLKMPKTSSRAITSAAGTADVIETIAKVEFKEKKLRKILQEANAFLAWGGSLGLAPADDKLIRVERLLNIDPEPQLIASILAKKISVGSTHVLIDIPYGNSAKVSKKKAKNLSRKFREFGKYFNIKVKCVLTKGSNPIGKGIGPNLEMNDIISVLKQDNDRPLDLEKKSVFLAGKILEITGKVKKGKGEKKAYQILKSGKAFEQFKKIISSQDGKVRKLIPGKYKKEIKAHKSGKITLMDNKKINQLARVAGSPVDKSAGLYLLKNLKEKVEKGEKLLTLYSASKQRLEDAADFYSHLKPILIK